MPANDNWIPCNPTTTTGGGSSCSVCGQWIPIGNIHFCSPSQPVMLTPPQTGWICPSCGRGNAPWVATCSHPLPSANLTGATP